MTIRCGVLRVAVAAALLGTPVSASAADATAAAIAPGSSQPFLASDGSLRYPFNGRVEPTLTCRPLYVCDVALENGETILNLGIGDSARWVIAAAQSGPNGATPHVLVKPVALDLSTNLIVTTTKRVYYLRLESQQQVLNPRISFSYPEEAEVENAARAAEAKRKAEEAAAELPLLPPDQLDSAYRIDGDRSFRPQKVFNDGVHTYLDFDVLPNDLPVLYAVASDNSEQIVNFRLRGTTFIVDGTPTGIDLILNGGTGRHGRGEQRVSIRHK